MLKIVTISPAQAVQFPNSSNGNQQNLPVPRNAYKYFQTSDDAQRVLALVNQALNDFATLASQGGWATVGDVTMFSSLQGDGGSDFIGVLIEGNPQPTFIYTDPDLKYQVYIINYNISFRLPSATITPNPVVNLTNQMVAIGDIAGAGTTSIVATYVDGEFSFSWK